MDEQSLRDLVEGIQAGTVSPDAAVERLRRLPFASAADGAALVDHHRALRQGMPAAVYAPGKPPDHCVAIIGELLTHGAGPVLLTRTDAAQRDAVLAQHPDAVIVGTALAWRLPVVPDDVPDDQPNHVGGVVVGAPSGLPHDAQRTPNDAEPPVSTDLSATTTNPSASDAHARNQHITSPRVLVITAGTADVPVADEAALTLCAYGIQPDRLHDVGVAGLHRLLAHLDRVQAADAVIVIAGMEGALASVIGGLVAGPVVAVPTSVGYGAGLDGVTALLAMHASCASGVTVVGIDNGFGAAVAVTRMMHLADGASS